jgi:hypothetical protein
METVQGEFGYDEFLHFENHVSGTDPFTTTETDLRGDWYGVSGIPHVRIDGKYNYIGAGSCASAATQYRSRINTRLTEVGHNSPVSIVGSYLPVPNTNDIIVQATFELLDPVSLVNQRATLLVYENNINWCCGYGGVDEWKYVTRGIYDQNVVFSQVGDEVTISTTFVHNGDWNPDEIYAVAYLQQTSGDKQIIQGALLPRVLDFTFDLEHKVRSVPSGNGVAVFNATLKNLSSGTDTITLEPGTALGDWTTDFLVCGDNTPHSGPVEVTLDAGEECAVQIRVHTNATVAERTGGFRATSAASLRSFEAPLRVFNGSYSVLLVDDDTQNTDEVKLENALTQLGYVYENWDVYNGHSNDSPTFDNMSGFDYVIWQTGLRFNNLLTGEDIASLMEYMDRGGSLFLTSQSFLDSQTGGPTTFTTNYLGVDNWVLDRRYLSMNGIAGDEIGDGLSLPLTFEIPSFNDTDHLVVGATAEGSFIAPDGSISTVHNTMPLRTDAKSVFMAVAFNAISDTDADPNNTRVVLQRIMDWLRPEAAASADDLPTAIKASRIDGASPNPFNPRTQINFTLSGTDASHPVRLEVFDLEGRKVAGLVDAQLSAGAHHQVWDGRADDGSAVRSGVYFARLTTREGEKSEKLMLLK